MFPNERVFLLVISLLLSGYLSAQTESPDPRMGLTDSQISTFESAHQIFLTTADVRISRSLLISGVMDGLNRRAKAALSSSALMPYRRAINTMMMMWSGTNNFVPKFVDNNGTLGNSDLFDSGGLVGIGTTNPQAPLDIEEYNSNSVPAILIQSPYAMQFGTFTCCGAGPAGSTLSSSGGYSSAWNGVFLNSNGSGAGNAGGSQMNTSLPSWRMGLGSGGQEWPGADSFAIGRVAAGGNYAAPSILFSINNAGKIKVAGGVDATGGGVKHARAGGCSATAQNSCSVTVSWPGGAFADTNYTAACTPDNAGQGIFSITAKSTTSVTVTISPISVITGPNTLGFSYNVNMSGVECMAMHD